jgi:hypothetical protein
MAADAAEPPDVHLVQLLLPLSDAEGRPFPRRHYDGLALQLTERFGGITAYTRSPAAGLWESGDGERVRDQVIVYEVMVHDLDRAWWAALREQLESRFAQDEIVIRAQPIERL